MKKNEEMYIDVILPEGTQEMIGKQLPSIDSILTWKDYSERRLHVDGVIDDSIVSTIGYFIKRYNLEDEGIPVEQRKPIKHKQSLICLQSEKTLPTNPYFVSDFVENTLKI